MPKMFTHRDATGKGDFIIQAGEKLKSKYGMPRPTALDGAVDLVFEHHFVKPQAKIDSLWSSGVSTCVRTLEFNIRI